MNMQMACFEERATLNVHVQYRGITRYKQLAHALYVAHCTAFKDLGIR